MAGLKFNSYEAQFELTLPRREEVRVRVVEVRGLSSGGREVQLPPPSEAPVDVADYLEFENRLVRVLFLTLSDVFHGRLVIRKLVYDVPEGVLALVERVEVSRRSSGGETITLYELEYRVGAGVELASVSELSHTST